MHSSAHIETADKQTYLDALLRGDKRVCAEIVQRQVDREIPVRVIFIDLFQDSLYAVGQLWELNRISVATEHLATSITLSLFHIVYPQLFSVPRRGKTAIVACTSNEYHFIGARMVSDVCELHGWDGHFVGANTPVSDLCSMVVDTEADLVALSLTLYSHISSLLTIIDRVRDVAPNIPIIVGGQGLLMGGDDIIREYPNVMYHRKLDEFEAYLDQS